MWRLTMRITEPYTIFLRTLSSGKQIYYYQFRYEDGRRSAPRSTGCDTMAKAKRFCQRVFASGQMSVLTDIKFKDFAKDFFSEEGDFCQWKAVNGKPLKPETARRYNTSLRLHILPYFDSYEMDSINRDTCKKWIIWANKQWSPKTVNNAQCVLNLIFESAMEKDIMQRNPLHKLGFRKIQKKKRELLTTQEVRTLYGSEWPSDIHRKMFLLAVTTGMRIGEIAALKSCDIKDVYINVHSDYSDRYGLQETTKTGMSRYVPIPKDFPFPEPNGGWAFSLDGKEPVKGHAVYNAMTRRCEKLGIQTGQRGITVHSLRNFFVSYLQKMNVPEPKIRATVGHADSTMTDLYTYWKPDMFQEVYEAQKKLFEEITQ